jgi:hypothetical protein
MQHVGIPASIDKNPRLLEFFLVFNRSDEVGILNGVVQWAPCALMEIFKQQALGLRISNAMPAKVKDCDTILLRRRVVDPIVVGGLQVRVGGAINHAVQAGMRVLCLCMVGEQHPDGLERCVRIAVMIQEPPDNRFSAQGGGIDLANCPASAIGGKIRITAHTDNQHMGSWPCRLSVPTRRTIIN